MNEAAHIMGSRKRARAIFSPGWMLPMRMFSPSSLCRPGSMWLILRASGLTMSFMEQSVMTLSRSLVTSILRRT